MTNTGKQNSSTFSYEFIDELGYPEARKEVNFKLRPKYADWFRIYSEANDVGKVKEKGEYRELDLASLKIYVEPKEIDNVPLHLLEEDESEAIMRGLEAERMEHFHELLADIENLEERYDLKEIGSIERTPIEEFEIMRIKYHGKLLPLYITECILGTAGAITGNALPTILAFGSMFPTYMLGRGRYVMWKDKDTTLVKLDYTKINEIEDDEMKALFKMAYPPYEPHKFSIKEKLSIAKEGMMEELKSVGRKFGLVHKTA